MPEWVTVLYTRFHVKPYLPNSMRCFRCQKFGHKQTRCTSDICPKCGMKDHGDTICSWPIRCINCSGSHMSSSPDCRIFLQEKAIQNILVEEHLSFPEARNKYFELQPKQNKVTYSQAAASRPPTSETSTQTDDPSTTPATAALRIRPCGPRTLVEPAEPLEIPQNHQPPKQAPRKQSASDLSSGPTGGRREGPFLDLESSRESLDMDTSDCTTNPKTATRIGRLNKPK
jgi:hypothetical protein